MLKTGLRDWVYHRLDEAVSWRLERHEQVKALPRSRYLPSGAPFILIYKQSLIFDTFPKFYLFIYLSSNYDYRFLT